MCVESLSLSFSNLLMWNTEVSMQIIKFQKEIEKKKKNYMQIISYKNFVVNSYFYSDV